LSLLKLPNKNNICWAIGGVEILPQYLMMEYKMTENVNKDQLMQFIERIERLEEDKKAISDDIKDIYTEAKSSGYETKIIRKIVSLRRKTKEQRVEEETLLDLYMNSIGMI
jgi:uncharacterized protein (UPF0335 family)